MLNASIHTKIPYNSVHNCNNTSLIYMIMISSNYWKKLFIDRASVNKKYLTDSVSVNKKYLTDSGRKKYGDHYWFWKNSPIFFCF